MSVEQYATFSRLVDTESRRHGFRAGPEGSDEVVFHGPDGGVIRITLEQLARRVHAYGGDDWTAFVANEFAKATALIGASDAPLDLSTVRVQLRSELLIDEMRNGGTDVVWRPWWRGTALLVAVDLPQHARSLLVRERRELDITDNDLFKLGIRNVLAHERPQVHGAGTSKVMLTGDVYTSTFALAPSRHVTIDPAWGSLTAVPNRHTVVHCALGPGAGSVLQWLATATLPIFEQDPGPVTNSLFWRRGGEVHAIAIERRLDGSLVVDAPPALVDLLGGGGTVGC